MWQHQIDVNEFLESVSMIASDVEYSIKRVLNPATLSPGAVWLKNVIAFESGSYAIHTEDDSTLTIKLNSPFAPFLGRLSMPYFSVIPHEAVEQYGEDFGRNPVGTGPFYFKMMKEGVKLVLLKNEHYFEFEDSNRLPYLDAVAVSFIIDKQSVFLEFIKGNLDFMSGIDPSYKDELLQADGSLNPKYSSLLNMTSRPYLNTEYLGFMMDTVFLKQNSPVKIKKIRQAINYGFSKIVDFDYEAAIERVSQALKAEGFGLLTEIDVKATLKKKLDVDFKPYKILGACMIESKIIKQCQHGDVAAFNR